MPAQAQNSDIIHNPNDYSETHSVKKATMRSVIFPGLGQAYNKKYWKMGVIYAGMGTAIYFAVDNNQQYQLYRDAFFARIDDDPNTIGGGDSDLYNERQLIELQNIYRRWRDLSIILCAAVYGLNIIDAHVDAHLFYYDVSENLNLSWEPALIRGPYSNSIGVGIKLNFN